MTVLLSRIQKDLFDFASHDPDDFSGLVEFWYESNSPALSAALTAQTGLSLLVNVSNFHHFESLAKKLFLIADTLILRDTRKWTVDELGYKDMPVPISDYKPGYLNDLIDQLKVLRPSPLTLLHRFETYWTSTTKKLNNGYQAAYVGGHRNCIPAEFIEWISTSGRNYMETGKIVYAPFIPPLEMELEFLKEGLVLPDYFNSTPCFHQNHDWLSNNQIQALLSLKIPFLDGLDIQTIAEVKQDHQDEFSTFSRTMLDSINGVKSLIGSEGFLKEVKNIQRNQIDAALSDVSKTIRRINTSKALRKGGILTGLLGLNGAALLGAPTTAIVTGIAASSAALVMERVAHIKEQGELKDKKGYFLWKLQDISKSSSS